MALLYSDIDLFNKIQTFVCSANNFVLFVPYIKAAILSKLLDGITVCQDNAIITTWKPQDIALGVTDIDVFPLCQEKGITLLINNRIHLKSYIINDFRSSIVTSSNISNRGFALKPNYNYELGAFIAELDIDDKIYFDMIIEESKEVTQSFFTQVKKQVSSLQLRRKMPEEFDIEKDTKDKDFLITALPMSENVDNLIDIYMGNRNYDEATLRSAMHDLRLYKISPSCEKEAFLKLLKINFFDHPFIIKFLKYNNIGKSFGTLTEWLHNNCVTVPSPRRSDFKSALQRIFRFVIYLSDGAYIIEVPKSRSEILRKIF
jgi:hypothetical protein